MSDLPDPLTPPECDLDGFNWMPLWGEKLFGGSWYRAARKDARGGIASLKLWWVAMTQHPAGSLPNDEEELCMLADFGEDMKAWNRHRTVAMHGFILCSDNRWYHPFVAEQAVEAYSRKLKAAHTREATAERVRKWRAAQQDSNPPPKPNGQDHQETQDETRYSNRYREPVTRYDTRFSGLTEDNRQKTEESTPPRPPRDRGGRLARRKPEPRNAFGALDQAAQGPPTIDGTAENVEFIDKFLVGYRGKAHG